MKPALFCPLLHTCHFSTAEELLIIELSPGATFGVAVTAFVLGLVDAILVLVFSRQAGDGPLWQCVSSLIAANQQGHPVMEGQKPPSQGAVVTQEHRVVLTQLPPTYASQTGDQGLPPPYEPAAAGIA